MILGRMVWARDGVSPTAAQIACLSTDGPSGMQVDLEGLDLIIVVIHW